MAANIAEAWQKRRYRAAFISKLNDAEAEAAETQTWLHFACRCGYCSDQESLELDRRYEIVLGQLVRLINSADQWCQSVDPHSKA